MTAELFTQWQPAPHTLAKHQIFRSYLDAWVPIMANYARRTKEHRRLLVVDGFAGPGMYGDGQPGSPIQMIESVLQQRQRPPLPVSLLLIEKDEATFTLLEGNVRDLRMQALQSGRFEDVALQHGDCQAEIEAVLQKHDRDGKPVGPAFFFLDQFGYAAVPMVLIRNIMQRRYCEVLVYLNWRDLSRFLTDGTKWRTISRVFGSNDWKDATSLSGQRRAAHVLESYKQGLREQGDAPYVWNFSMCDQDGQLLYWLFFCTKSLRGLEEMKKAMLRVDATGRFRFSDRDDPEQSHMFVECDVDMVASELRRLLGGQTVSVAKVREIVLTETASVRHKPALRALEERGELQVLNARISRRCGTFAQNSLRVQFA